MSKHWNPNDAIVQFRSDGGTGGTRAPVTVLIAAVFAGLVVGAILVRPEAAPRAMGFNAAPIGR
jgi:hypothetical protein